MPQHTTPDSISKEFIDEIGVTSDTLTGRGGLALFVRYLRNIDLFPHLERLFGSVKKNRKGLPVTEMFKQLICFFVDGTSRHLVHFDCMREDSGYAAAIETPLDQMISSHALKRFLRGFWWPRIFLFRRLLIKMFIWRLHLAKPDVIVLGLDTTVLDNHSARSRHGVEPTYRKKQGFQPLLLNWQRFVIDAVFRGGSKHSNHGKTAEEMLRHVIREIRKHYREDVPILIRFDAGFFDQKLFRVLEELKVGYTATGKLYDDIKIFIGGMDPRLWGQYQNGDQLWDFVEFGDRRGNWKRFRRAFYLRPHYEEHQQLLEFARPETVLYTNVGMGTTTDDLLCRAGRADLLKPEAIIELHHARGADELVIRATKEFASEMLPFKRFNQNAAYYYTMLLSFFLFESFKEDVGKVVVPVTTYPTTVRRKLIDIAAKIVRHGGKVTLKVTRATFSQIKLSELWRLSGTPPEFVWS
jgi:hypothetical protein